MLNWKKTVTLLIVCVMFLSISLPAFAINSTSVQVVKTNDALDALPIVKKTEVESAIEDFTFENSKEYSVAENKLVMEVAESPKENLVFADVINGEVATVYQTSDENIQVAVTDDYVEIVERVDDNNFIINGEEVNLEYTIDEEPVTVGNDFSESDDVVSAASTSSTYYNYARTANPGGSWVKTVSSVHNIYLSNMIKTFTAAALASIIGYKVGQTYGSVVGGVTGFVAGLLLASPYTNTSTARVRIDHYKHASYPILYKRTYTKSYAIYQGSEKFLGGQFHYYSKMFCSAC